MWAKRSAAVQIFGESEPSFVSLRNVEAKTIRFSVGQRIPPTNFVKTLASYEQSSRSRERGNARDLLNAFSSCVTSVELLFKTVSQATNTLDHKKRTGVRPLKIAKKKMYPVPSYNRNPQAAQPVPVQRRHPLTNAVNNVNHQETPPKPLQKVPASPPLPRQNPKVTPPSPPKIITDKGGKLQFHRVGFLGEVCGSHCLALGF